MNSLKWIATTLVCAVGLNQAQAQNSNPDLFRLLGAPEAAIIASRLVVAGGENGTCGSISYDPTQPNIQGRVALDRGEQYAAFQVSPMRQLECNLYPNARQAVVAGDRMPIIINNNNRGAARCDSRFISDVPGYSSSVPAWAEVLQLIYGGRNGDGTQAACSASARANLVNNWSSLWVDGCTGGSKCDKLRFAFRQGDENPATLVLKKLLDVKAFCNGAQNEDKDPLRTTCKSSSDIDWCPNGLDLGVVQAIQLDPVRVYPRLACVQGNFDFGFAPVGETVCPDGTAPFASLFCSYPRDCEDRFGCINSFGNSSTFNFFMDGRDYNKYALDRSLNKIQIPEDASYSFIYMNGNCTGGRTGSRTDAQIGCLVNQTACSMSLATGRSVRAPVTINEEGSQCGTEVASTNQVAGIKGVPARGGDEATAIDYINAGPGYPLYRPIFYTTLRLPTVDGKFDCSQSPNAQERLFCECVFNKSLLDNALSGTLYETVPEVRILECGAKL